MKVFEVGEVGKGVTCSLGCGRGGMFVWKRPSLSVRSGVRRKRNVGLIDFSNWCIDNLSFTLSRNVIV